MDPFYVVLNRKATFATPGVDNEPDTYRVDLDRPLRLDEGQWLVALCEIYFVSKRNTRTSLWVYSNVCEMTFVGEGETPFLRYLFLNRRNTSTHVTYENPYYIATRKAVFDNIEITIKDDAGNSVALRQEYPVVCVLHFKPLRSPYFT